LQLPTFFVLYEFEQYVVLDSKGVKFPLPIVVMLEFEQCIVPDGKGVKFQLPIVVVLEG
jgi:hypothetical protein